MKKSRILIFLVVILYLTACSKQDERIIGKWQDEVLGASSYTFSKDGKVTIDNGLGGLSKGTYKIKGDALILEVNDKKMEVTYKIEGDTLTFDRDKEVMTYSRVKKGKKAVTADKPIQEDVKEEEATEDEAVGDEMPESDWVSTDIELQNITDKDDNAIHDVYAEDDFIYILLKSTSEHYFLSVYQNNNVIKKDIPLEFKTFENMHVQGPQIGFRNGKISNKVLYQTGNDLTPQSLYYELVSFDANGLIKNDTTVLYDGHLITDELVSVGSINTTEGLGVVKRHEQQDENDHSVYEIIPENNPSKSIRINDKKDVLKDSSLMFYDAEKNYLYYSKSNGIYILDNEKGEPVYENGVDKNLGFTERKMDYLLKGTELTILYEGPPDSKPTIVKLDTNFQPLTEIFRLETSYDDQYSSYLCSPDTAIIWKQTEFERSPALKATIITYKE